PSHRAFITCHSASEMPGIAIADHLVTTSVIRLPPAAARRQAKSDKRSWREMRGLLHAYKPVAALQVRKEIHMGNAFGQRIAWTAMVGVALIAHAAVADALRYEQLPPDVASYFHLDVERM